MAKTSSMTGSASGGKGSGSRSSSGKSAAGKSPAANKNASAKNSRPAGTNNKAPGGAANGPSGESSGSTAKTAAKSKAAKLREEEQAREREYEQQKRNIISLCMFAFSIVFALLVLFPSISKNISDIVYGLFGRCSILWAAAFFIISAITSKSMDDDKAAFKCKMTFYFAVVISSFVHCASKTIADNVKECRLRDVFAELYTYGTLHQGAGVLGGIFGAAMAAVFGRVLSMIIIIVAAFVVVMLFTGTTLPQLGSIVLDTFGSMKERTDEIVYRIKEAQRKHDQALEKEAEEFLRQQQKEIDDSFYNEINSPTTAQLDSRRRYHGFGDAEYSEEEPEEEYDVPEEDRETEEDVRTVSEKPEGRVVETFGRVRRRGRPVKKTGGDNIMDDLIGEDGTLTEVPEFMKDEKADVTEDQLEELYDRVINQSRRQREEELLSDTIEFAAEVEENDGGEPVQYHFPPLSLLSMPEDVDDSNLREELRNNADRLVNVLAEYHVSVSVSDISHGPQATRYELTPAPGVQISKITKLSDDIAMRLAALAVRMEAPIPGKSAVGVEIPNSVPGTVYERTLINSDTFRNASNPVTVTIGQDIDGNNIFADISKLTHLLIAGTTGTGKSVCINSMLISLLYKASPADVRLIMVDPKAVELDIYNGIPHLLVPVVSDPQKAAGALQWAVGEMEKRYSLLKDCEVRNIDGYNKKADNDPSLRHMPRIVIVIDELADLMMTSPKEVETAIGRLAAKARAAGIHLILATQRPSVDVITGTIKNNIPSRIAFSVTSAIDSRTILDEGGAEELIGRGDMLFKPIGQKPLRVQGCFVSDEDVSGVIKFITDNSEADYDDEIAKEIERNAAGASGEAEGFDDSEEDELFIEAAEVVVEAGQASTSMLQRRLGVGYARAGRMIDQLCERGIIGPFCGSKPRDVLYTPEQLLELKYARSQPRQPLPEPAQHSSAPSLSSHRYAAALPAENGAEDAVGEETADNGGYAEQLGLDMTGYENEPPRDDNEREYGEDERPYEAEEPEYAEERPYGDTGEYDGDGYDPDEEDDGEEDGYDSDEEDDGDEDGGGYDDEDYDDGDYDLDAIFGLRSVRAPDDGDIFDDPPF